MNWRQKFGIVLTVLGSISHCHAANSPDACHILRKHGQQTQAKACYESLVHSNSAYLRAEGYWGLEQYDQANEEFRIATAAQDSDPLYKVRWGMLLHQRFNNNDAVGLFKEALQRTPKMRRRTWASPSSARTVLTGKPRSTPARRWSLILSWWKLMNSPPILRSRMRIQNKPSRKRMRHSACPPDALNAMAIHAAVELLADRPPDPWLDKIRKVNPTYGEGYALVAHHLELNYRFDDAIVYYRKAIEADPRLWSARSQLGVSLMRLGQEDEPFKQLEMCYDNGYRDAETVNSLRLLDSYKNFVTYKENGTVLRLRKNEAELLHPYFEAELQRIIATYDKKYQTKLTGPVQVEVYPDHEDFAVRTMGMPGLGALGVTFGQVVAMDSPAARKPGDFNWGSTLWHEMSHVYVLSLTNGRVPRWFTEGVAVHEETQVSPEWGDRVSPDILVAIRDKKLLPIAKLDRGFIFPDYPAQVVVSYFEAGSICDYIKSHWGEGKLLDMIHSYAQRKSTPEVIQEDLGVSPDTFDKQYLEWLNQRYGTMAANFDEWRKSLERVAEASKLSKTTL